MSKKYEIINDGGRKRIRSLRSFSVQGRTVEAFELGGYVYDENTLSHDGTCWIFSGALEHPNIRVIDEAIVDMGSNDVTPDGTYISDVVIRGSSTVYGPVFFTEGEPFGVQQKAAMYEQGFYIGYAGQHYRDQTEKSDTRIRSKAMTFGNGKGSVSFPTVGYDVKCDKMDHNGIVIASTAWKTPTPPIKIDF